MLRYKSPNFLEKTPDHSEVKMIKDQQHSSSVWHLLGTVEVVMAQLIQ